MAPYHNTIPRGYAQSNQEAFNALTLHAGNAAASEEHDGYALSDAEALGALRHAANAAHKLRVK